MKKIILGLAVVAMAAATSAFTTNGLFSTNYHYKESSTSLVELRKLSNWDNDPNPSCSTEDDLPCVIEFTPTSEDPDFQTFLNNRDLNELVQEAISTKGI